MPGGDFPEQSLGEGPSHGLAPTLGRGRGRKGHPGPSVQIPPPPSGKDGRLSYFKRLLQAYSVTCFEKNCFKI